MANTLTFANQTLTDANIFGGINYICDLNTGDEFSIGNTASASVSFVTEVQLPIYTKDAVNGTFVWEQDNVTRGRFYITEVTRDHSFYTVTAYDAMMLLDTNIAALPLSYPLTVSTAASAIAAYIDCTISGNINNGTMSVATLDSNMTCRQLLAYIGEASGCSVKIDGSDHLCFMYYADSGETLTASDYIDLEVADYVCSAITGVTILNFAGLIQATSGTDTNQLYISGNPFLEEATNTEAATILSQVSGLVYTPLTCQLFDDDGIEVGTIVTFGTAETLVMHVDLNTESGATVSSVGSDTRAEYNKTIEDVLNEVLVIAQEASDTAELSIVTDTLHYLATDLSSDVTISTPGWTTTVQSMSSTNKYLWTYHTYTKANGNSVNTNPVITGVYGDKGQNGQNGNDGADGATIWTTTTAPTTPNYTFTKSNLSGPSGMTQKVGDLIVYSYYRYTITTVSTSTVKAGSRVSIRGSAGAASKWYSGTGITGTSTTATIFPNSGVSSAVVGDMYLNTSTGYTYRCTTAGAASAAKWVYTTDITGPQGEQGIQGEQGEQGPQGIQGIQGPAGNDGVSVTGIQPQYYLSDSSSSLTGGSWSNTLTYTSGKFIWTRDEISYSNNTTGHSTAVYNAVLTASASTDQYFWHVTSGGDAGTHITQIPKATFESNPAGGNTLITSTGIAIRDGLTELATFGANGAQIGKSSGGHTTIQASGMQVYGNDGTLELANIGYGLGNSESGTAEAPHFTLGVRTIGSDVGNYSVAEGSNVTASAFGAHAEGVNTVASDAHAHAEGRATVASGHTSHAEGYGTTASGDDAHAEGYDTTAGGESSHAEGIWSEATGMYSHAQNEFTIAQRANQTAIGMYNVADTTGLDETNLGDYVLIIGNGTSNNARSNALTVDWTGNVEMGLPNYQSSGSTDKALYDAITALGWTSDVIV